MLQEPPPFFEMISIVIPGNDIPVWFSNQSVGALVRSDCTSCSKANLGGENPIHSEKGSKRLWIGFALCVLFGPEGAFDEDPDLEPHANTISCSWKPDSFVPASFSYSLNKVVKSDHLCLFLLPSKYFPEYIDSWDERWIDFFFEADACLKVKKCGVRALYKQDVKEVNSRMDQKLNYCSTSISARKGYLTVQEPPPFFEVFCTIFPENDIPLWLKNASIGHSVKEMLPCSSCSGTWIGFVVCALFTAFSLDKDHASKILLDWNPSLSYHSGYSCDVDQVESSAQLCVFFVPMDKFQLSPRFVNFVFRTVDDACSMVLKWCGVRPLYRQDVTEHVPNTRMNQYTESMTPWNRIPDLFEDLR